MNEWLGIIFLIIAVFVTIIRIHNNDLLKKKRIVYFVIGAIACLIGLIGWFYLGWTF